MEESASDRLPERWVERANRLKAPTVESNQVGGEEEETASTQALQQWLEEVYLDGGKKAELSLADVRKVGELVRKILWFEPCSRGTAAILLKNTWLS